MKQARKKELSIPAYSNHKKQFLYCSSHLSTVENLPAYAQVDKLEILQYISVVLFGVVTILPFPIQIVRDPTMHIQKALTQMCEKENSIEQFSHNTGLS